MICSTIGEVCDKYGGEIQTGPFGSQLHASDYSVDGVPVIMPQDMVDGHVDSTDAARVDELHVNRLRQHVLCAGDIIFSRRGDVSRFAVITDKEAGWLCGTGSIRIRLNCPDISIDYARVYLRQGAIRAWLEHHAKGVTMPNLNTQIIRSIPISYPPLPEQRRIADILDRADALRAKRRAALARLDELTQAIFIEMFGDPVSNPKGWDRKSLADVCDNSDDIKCGPFGTQLARDKFTEEGVPLWGIRNVNVHFKRPTTEFVSHQTARRFSQYSIEPGDIVMTRKGTIGNCAVYPPSFPNGIMHSDLLRLRIGRSKCTADFLTHQLQHSRDVERQLALISGGAIMPGINVTKLKLLQVLLPPVKAQKNFDLRVEKIRAIHERQSEAFSKSDSLFASLQDRAFRGAL